MSKKLNRDNCRYFQWFMLFLFFTIPCFAASETTISYFYDGEQIESIDSVSGLSFEPYTKTINQGLKTGTYWIKIKANEPVVVQIKNSLIKGVKAFSGNDVVLPLPTHNFESFHLSSGTSYLEVKVNKFAFIPVATFSHDGFLKAEQRQNAVIGMFYGFGFMVLLLNLLFYVIFRDRTFLYYMLFLSSLLITFAHRDGFISMLGVSGEMQRYTEVTIHFLISLASVLFSSEYLQMRTRYPKFLIMLYAAVIVSLSLDVIYLLTDSYLFNALSDTVIIGIFLGIWYISLLLAKKHQYALLFFIAYSLIILFGLDFYLSAAFGWFHLGVDQYVIKLGSYFEMLIMTWAVVLRVKTLKLENDEMRLEIEQKIQKINNLMNNINNGIESANPYARYELSNRELNIVELIAIGQTNKKIANDLNISINTVKYHVKNIYQKLAIKSRKEIQKVIQ